MSASELRSRLRADLASAMKAREEVRVRTLRMLESALQNEEIAKKLAALSEEDVFRVLALEEKRRREAADAYRRGGAKDRAEAELAEAAVLAAYLPRALSDDELEAVVREVLAARKPALEPGSDGRSPLAPADVGRVTGLVMARVRGRASGARAKEIVSRILGP